MLTPDRVIVRKLKQYDPNLFVQWNNEKNFFELWMKRPWHRGGGAVLITPSLSQKVKLNSQLLMRGFFGGSTMPTLISPADIGNML
jgi:hypothetical protein